MANKQLDQCANKAINHIEMSDVLLPSINVIDDGKYVTEASATLRNIWMNTDINLDQAIKEYEKFLLSLEKL